MVHVKRVVHVQFAGMLFGVCVVAWIVRTFPIFDFILVAQRKIGQMQPWGVLVYPMLYAGCNVLLLPAGVLAIGSGLFFGLWWGFAINLAGNVGGAVIAFFISRKLGRQWVARKFFKYRKWAALDAAIGRDGWKIIFLSQVHPLFPTSLLNYLYGVTRIGFGTCMLWVALGQAPGLFLYAYLGTVTQFGVRVWQGESHPQPLDYMLWIGGLVLTFAATILLGRIAFRLLREAGEASKEDKADMSLA
jgi:uncharacterized membrane protein YdjX (TVP38/TMEM64 family)